jgi:trans-2,3-dihydro-3-hydroxyanthranilate isomerase
MRKLHYHWIDVFTDRAFGGNQLAVFTNGRGISTELMQSIAREFNISETTFVLPPEDARNDYRVRIFTPAAELPMAGHPTVGTTFVLAREQMIEQSSDGETHIKLEEGIGTIPVKVSWREGSPVFAQMTQPQPKFGPRFEDVKLMAEMLSVEAGAIAETNLPLEIVSCGMPFLFVPVRDLATIRGVRLRLDIWEHAMSDFPAAGVFIFTREVEHAGSRVHSRMFAPGMGIIEDPATGGASGPLGCYLVRHQVFDADDGGDFECTSEQGIEMGRPSFIKINIEHQRGEIRAVKVGGQCRFVGEGFLEV